VLHEVVVLLVGLVGLLLEGHLLVGVGLVPLVDRRPVDVVVVLAGDVGDRSPAGQSLAGVTTPTPAPAATTTAATAGHEECTGRERGRD
jgi:hypothetical protein